MLENQELRARLCEAAGEGNVLLDEPMNKHTTFRIGGPADYFVIPHSREEIQKAVKTCRELGVPYYILGNVSNLLVGDKGYRGVVIQVYKNFSQVKAEGEEIAAQAGALLSVVANTARKASLAGLEFASGIPGTVGGAAAMNAGAYGGEMKDVLKEITVLTGEGEFLTIPKGEMELGYRTSVVAKRGYLVLEARLALRKGDGEAIAARMEELKARRIEKQPLEYPSAGSTFKRPEGYFAGKLIMDAGLRGFSVGGAMVSEKHCGFVINRGEATARDVLELMKEVRKRVREKFGVELEPEVKMLGEFE